LEDWKICEKKFCETIKNKKLHVMATILKFEDLEIWKEAVKIGVEIYR
jgi:hypothetical protein